MQRQSLGSPGSRHPLHVLAADADEDRRRSGRWSRGGGVGGVGTGNELPEAAAARGVIVEEDKEEERKPQLPRPPSPEKTVHLIPVLTLFCFLVLFLVSHDPSTKDLGQFEGSAALLHTTDMNSASAAAGLGRLTVGAESTMSKVSAVRGHRRLNELEKEEKVRGVGGVVVRSRKLGGAGLEERHDS